MNRKTFDTERMCRVGGQQPNAREKWLAFHRLYRLAQGRGMYQDLAVGECFRVLMRDWSPAQLMEDREASPSRVAAPPFLRRILLTADRRKRLGYPDPEQLKAVARSVRESHGAEVTPDQVAEVRVKVLRLARAKGLELGFPLPDGDEELWEFLRETLAERHP